MTQRTEYGNGFTIDIVSGQTKSVFPNVHPDAVVDDSVIVFGDPANLYVGAGSRVDAFCVLSVGTDPANGVRIGRRTHVGCGCYLFGSSGRITVGDCCSLSPRVTVYTASDRMERDNLIGPCVPENCRSIKSGDVRVYDGAALFHGVTVMPRVTVGPGEIVRSGATLTQDVPLREYALVAHFVKEAVK